MTGVHFEGSWYPEAKTEHSSPFEDEAAEKRRKLGEVARLAEQMSLPELDDLLGEAREIVADKLDRGRDA